MRDLKKQLERYRNDKTLLCDQCGEPLIGIILKDVYVSEVFTRPHIEIICHNCGMGNAYKLETFKANSF